MRSRVPQRADVVVLVVDWLQASLASEIMIAAPQHARDLGVVPAVVDLGSQPHRLLDALARLVGRRPRGIVVATPVAADPTVRVDVERLLDDYQADGGNVSTLGIEGFPYPGAFFPEGDAAFSMARSLVDRGFMAPAILDAAIARPAIRARADGLDRGFLSTGLVVPPGRRFRSAFSVEHAEALVLELPDEWFGTVDVIACTDDVLALGAHRALTARGLRPGTDVGLSGFGDWLEVTDLTPSTTSARIPIRLATRRAIELTLSRSTDRAAFPVAINLRDTTPVRPSAPAEPTRGAAPDVTTSNSPAQPAARLIDVARLADTSIATASRVLNHKRGVRAETVASVRRAVATLRYEHDAVDRTRFGRSGRTIALLVPDLTDLVTAGVVQQVIAAGERRGHVHVLQCRLDDEKDLRAAAQARERSDGLVLYRPTLSAGSLRRLAARLAPLVVIDHPPPPRAAAVLVDHRQATWALGVHLADLGHRRLAVIRSAHPRVRALHDVGLRRLAVDRPLLEVVRPGPAVGPAALVDAVRRRGVTAVLMPDTVTARAMAAALQGAGVAVPAGVSVAGLAGWPGAPDMTTAVARDDLGELVWVALHGLGDSSDAPRTTWVPTQVHVGASSGPVGRVPGND